MSSKREKTSSPPIPNVIPRRFGFGLYFSDSEDSCPDSLRDWADRERNRVDDDEDSLYESVEGHRSIYASAREDSLNDGLTSSLSVDTASSDSDEFVVNTFSTPAPLGNKQLCVKPIPRDADWVEKMESVDYQNALFLHRTSRFEDRVKKLEGRRIQICDQLMKDCLASMTQLEAEQNVRKKNTSRSDQSSTAAPQVVDENVKSSSNSEDSLTSGDTDRSTSAKTESGNPPDNGQATQQAPAPEQPDSCREDVSKDAVPLIDDEASSESTASAKAEIVPETNFVSATDSDPSVVHQIAQVSTTPVSVIPTTTSGQSPQATNENVSRTQSSHALLRYSKELGVPCSHPPPETLFSLQSLRTQTEDEQMKVALHAAERAIDFEEHHRRIAHEMINSMGDFVESVSFASQRRKIEKHMKLFVAQISASKNQVQAAIKRILESMISYEGTGGLVYSYMQISRNVISKCAGVSNTLVFAVAKVVEGVIRQYPQLISILLSLLHEVSILTVPKYYSSEHQPQRLLDKLGFLDIAFDAYTRKETRDEFITRQSGFVKLYAAITELNCPVHGLEFGWSYLSRHLSVLPPTRITASALMSFLSIAGYSLHIKYGGQFFKVLLYIHSRFLVTLAASGDREGRAEFVRLQTYIQENHFKRCPEGKIMPACAESAFVYT